MTTTKINDTAFIYHTFQGGTSSANDTVEIVRGKKRVIVPWIDILRFVAEIKRREMCDKIEAMTDAETLGFDSDYL